jgi:hypothetical protein
MIRPDNAPIPEDKWDETWQEFARLWAFGRLDNGPKYSADSVALKMFTGDDRHIAAWVIAKEKWNLNPFVKRARDKIEAEFNKDDFESLCSKDDIKSKITKNMLHVMESEHVDPKDRVGAAKQLTTMYGLSEEPEGAAQLSVGSIIINNPDLNAFEQAAFKQQTALQERLAKQVIDMKVVNPDDDD